MLPLGSQPPPPISPFAFPRIRIAYLSFLEADSRSQGGISKWLKETNTFPRP